MEEDYEIFSSCGPSRASGSVALLFPKSLSLKIRAVFMDVGGRLMVRDMNGSEGGAFKLVAIYALARIGGPDFFRCLETF